MAPAPSRDHTCGVTEAGDMQCLGVDSYGQLGNGDAKQADDQLVTPLVSGGGTTSRRASASPAAGRRCEASWGDAAQVFEPIQIGGASTWSDVSASEGTICAIEDDRRLYVIAP